MPIADAIDIVVDVIKFPLDRTPNSNDNNDEESNVEHRWFNWIHREILAEVLNLHKTENEVQSLRRFSSSPLIFIIDSKVEMSCDLWSSIAMLVTLLFCH